MIDHQIDTHHPVEFSTRDSRWIGIKLTLARLWAWLWRFHGLKQADKLEMNAIASRPFFRLNLYLDLSRTKTHRLLFLEGSRFIEERHLISNLIKPGTCVVDVGANIGYYALIFWSFGAREIICFEPEPDNLIELRRNISKNRLSAVVHEAAVGMKNGKVRLTRGINGMIDRNGDLTVDLVTLDSTIPGKVELIKIDVEGYEAQVLLGANRLIKTHHPILFVELHPHMLTPDYSIADIVRFVENYYYSITFYERSPQSGFQKLQTRYLGANALGKVTNASALLGACAEGKKQDTFWMVCN